MKKFFGAFLLVISATTFAQLTPTLQDIDIPMRDGKSLKGDVYIPTGTTEGEVILIQTPYDKNRFSTKLPFGVGTNLDNQPYIFVIVDWRGFYGSKSAAVANSNRGEDAYDICEWITNQSWHANRIGTWGPSALGAVQYQLIAEKHPNHTCAVPLVATGHQSYDNYFYGGVLEQARLEQLDALGYGLSTVVLTYPYDSQYWTAIANNSWYADDIDIPTLQIGGWYDHNIDKMMKFYASARTETEATVRDKQWLLVGPWVHGGTGSAIVGSATQGELSYPNAEFKNDSMTLDFFNYHLLDSVNGWENTPLITYYEMGGNDNWKESMNSEIDIKTSSSLFLNQNGQLASFNGINSTSFTSDPNNPAPTIGGATLKLGLDQGPYDQSSLELREDIAIFSSPNLTQELPITGRVKVKLYISANQPDCDVAVRLVDEYPDGRNMLITDGIHRMRFRDGDFSKDGESFMEAGQIYPVEVSLPFTNYTWLSGHKIKIYVSGNHSTRFNVNEQTGGEMYKDGPVAMAVINIHHDDDYPSQIMLPTASTFLSITEGNLHADHLLIYPNPATDYIYFPEEIESANIFDFSGKLVFEIKNHVAKANITSLSRGTYAIEMLSENGEIHVAKLIKN